MMLSGCMGWRLQKLYILGRMLKMVIIQQGECGQEISQVKNKLLHGIDTRMLSKKNDDYY